MAPCGCVSSQRLRSLKVDCASRHMIPVRLSANPSATVRQFQPKVVSACRGLSSQYFKVISASKARRFAPVILDGRLSGAYRFIAGRPGRPLHGALCARARLMGDESRLFFA